jgi:predicted nucleic acid-binding protein
LIVVDASVVIEVLLLTRDGWRLGSRLFERGPTLCAPELLDVEVTQIVRRYQRLGDLTAERGQSAIADLVDLPLERFTHRPLLERMWEMRANLTAYDAAYVALAEALDAPLLTRDARLARAVHRARVEVV